MAGTAVSRGFGGNDLAISPTLCVVFVRFVNINVSIAAVVLLVVRYAWTAGRRVNATNFAWRVVTSKSYEVLPMHFTSWNAGEPNNQRGLDFCVMLHRNYNFKWADAVCGNIFSAVCEIDIA